VQVTRIGSLDVPCLPQTEGALGVNARRLNRNRLYPYYGDSMSSSSDSSGDTKSVGATGLGLIEKIWEAEWALRLVFGLLMLDLGLVIWGGEDAKGVLAWSADISMIGKNLGVVVTAVAVSSFFAALVIPILSACTGRLMQFVSHGLAKVFGAPEPATYSRPLGTVPAYELRRHALQEGSIFILTLYEEAQDRRQKWEAHLSHFSLLVFSDLVLAVIDGAWPLFKTGSSTLVWTGLDTFGTPGYVFAGAVVLGAFAILKSQWLPRDTPFVIFYPPLDDGLREREEAERTRNARLLEEGRETARRMALERDQGSQF